MKSHVRSVRQLLCATAFKFAIMLLPGTTISISAVPRRSQRARFISPGSLPPSVFPLMQQFQVTALFLKELPVAIRNFCRCIPTPKVPPLKMVRRTQRWFPTMRLSYPCVEQSAQCRRFANRRSCASRVGSISEPFPIFDPKLYGSRTARVKSVVKGHSSCNVIQVVHRRNEV